jgi:hypothetical protein
MLSNVSIDDLDEQSIAPRFAWERIVGALVVVACTIAVLLLCNPGMRVWPLWDMRAGPLLRDTTTNGGDMGAHVYWPWFLREHWFGQFRISGWSPDWYAGFPIGQFYFPLPAILISLLDLFLPYNIAFKWVTVSGPLLLPAAAYACGRGLRAPWPAPPAFAVAMVALLVHTRWTIYGGNLASNLAGEFSFTLGTALALFFVGALAHTLDTGKRPWLPAALLASAALAHIVVAAFAAAAGVLVWLFRLPAMVRARDTVWWIAVPIGVVGAAITAVWSLPLLTLQDYTQNMRYEKVVPQGTFQLWGPVALVLPAPLENTIEGLVRSVSKDATSAQPLWLPWWMWLLCGVAIVAAGFWRRSVAPLLASLALVFAVLFVQWPEHHVWNTRFLPFWFLAVSLLAALGAAEAVRALGFVGVRAFDWIREGDLQDARARAWAELVWHGSRDREAAASGTGSGAGALRVRLPSDPALGTPDDLLAEAERVLAERRFDAGPPGWAPPERLTDPVRVGHERSVVQSIVVTVLTAALALVGIVAAYSARDNDPDVPVAGWAAWNYSGYEAKAAWPEYRTIMEEMGQLPPGRALWEPSATETDPINNYGTSLALELLPYWTKGRIGSMEGLYFESSATTAFHFLNVSEVAKHPSNPVRGLVYGTLDGDFRRGVQHMQMLGVRYYMAWTKDAQDKADRNPNLRLVLEIPDQDGADPKGWKVYEVTEKRGNRSVPTPLVEGLRYEPVVADVHAGTTSSCFGQPEPEPGTKDPHLPAWECAAAPWFRQSAALDRPFAASGPKSWKRVDIADVETAPRTRLPAVDVTDIEEDEQHISFRVSRPGVPVVVKTSYFPNWKVRGADGPYRIAPNLMVVVPNEKEVSLEYALSRADWIGRIITLAGLVGLALLVGGPLRRRLTPGFRPARAPVSWAPGDTDLLPPPPGPGGSEAPRTEPPSEPTERSPALP